MSINRFRLVGVILLAFSCLTAGCTFIGGTQRPTKNYVLNSLYSEEVETQVLANLRNIGILVGPIRMALYLDRADIVIRDSQNQIAWPNSPNGPVRCKKISAEFWQKIYLFCWRQTRSAFSPGPGQWYLILT